MNKRLFTLALATTVSAPAFASKPERIDFDINAGKITPTEDFMIMVSVLGSAITSKGTDIPVTVQLNIGDQTVNPWGDATDHEAADVNDPYAPTRNYVVNELFEVDENSNPADTEVTITARSWVNGSVYIEANSHEQSEQVKILRDGDDVPSIDGLNDQADVLYFIEPYIDFDTNTISLDENQAIYLFEIGTTDMSKSSADFQDLVALVTFGKTKRDFYRYLDLAALYD
ncbi:MAG: hypothetical protein AAGI37_00975 [Planctomycetota bacterium]